MLTIEANGVIALRLTRMTFGGASALDEAVQMVQEKVSAAFEAGTTLMCGGSAASVIDRYRDHVQANSARLLAS